MASTGLLLLLLSQDAPAAQMQRAAVTIQAAAHALTNTPANPRPLAPETQREQLGVLSRALDDYVIAWCASQPAAEPDALADALRSVYDPWAAWREFTNAPAVTAATIRGRRYLVVSSLLFHGGGATPGTTWSIRAFDVTSSPARAVATASSDFTGDALVVRELRAPVEAQHWLLAYGIRVGDTGSRSDAAVYAFDGTRFATKWVRRDVPGLEIAVDGTMVHVKYATKQPAAGGGFAFEEFREDYRITPRGLDLISATRK